EGGGGSRRRTGAGGGRAVAGVADVIDGRPRTAHARGSCRKHRRQPRRNPVTIPLTDAPRVDAGRGPDSVGWPDRGALWTDDLEAWLPAFVGRARELDRLGDLLAQAAAGRPRIAGVEGEAGRGQSAPNR